MEELGYLKVEDDLSLGGLTERLLEVEDDDEGYHEVEVNVVTGCVLEVEVFNRLHQHHDGRSPYDLEEVAPEDEAVIAAHEEDVVDEVLVRFDEVIEHLKHL